MVYGGEHKVSRRKGENKEENTHVNRSVLPFFDRIGVERVGQSRHTLERVSSIHERQPECLNGVTQVFPTCAVPERAKEWVEGGSVPAEEVAGCSRRDEEEEGADEGDEEGGEEDGSGEVKAVVQAGFTLRVSFLRQYILLLFSREIGERTYPNPFFASR
jgi:hypothetical protein